MGNEKSVTEQILEKIDTLKRKHHGIILAHNYQEPEIQDMADFSGDSLELSRKAAATNAQLIVFCGVRFMAETASILSPNKTVLLPDETAGCPMADMIALDQLMRLKAEHPGSIVVCYVNSSAEVKAESDICCTSSNAVAVVRSLPRDSKILFVPDKHLGHYVSMQTGRDMILWEGFCPTHVRILPEDILSRKREYPQALVMAHPECPAAVRSLADEVLSTGGMCRFVSTCDSVSYIVGTEVGMLHRLRKENPGKTFIPASLFGTCPNMKKITLEKVLWCLESLEGEVRVSDTVRIKAQESLRRMLEVKIQ